MTPATPNIHRKSSLSFRIEKSMKKGKAYSLSLLRESIYGETFE